MTSSGRPAASWYPDPLGRHQHRYWDGEGWTLHVADDGVATIDAGSQQPAVQQPVVEQPVIEQAVVEQAVVQPVVQQPVVQPPTAPEPQPTATHWPPAATPGWTDATASSTPMYATQVSSPATGWQDPAAIGTQSRSSSGRGWIVGIAFLVAIVGIGATAMLALGRNDDTGTSGISDTQHYPAAVESGFMTGCTTHGGNTDYCRCTLDHLEESYDLDEFADAARSYQSTGKLPDSAMNAVNDCLHYLAAQQQ
jgi:hypothetical protein